MVTVNTVPQRCRMVAIGIAGGAVASNCRSVGMADRVSQKLAGCWHPVQIIGTA